MLTVTEAKALACAKVLIKEPTSWGKAEHEQANKELVKLMEQKEIDASGLGQAMAELGNVSAIRQLFEKHGVMRNNSAKPAFIVAVEKAVESETEKELAK